MSKTYTQPGEKGTDTNQASEDELKTKASDSSSEAGYTIIPELYEYCLGAGLKLSNYQAIELTKLIQKLIRTEKLKLLAEVRERVVGEKDKYNDIYEPDAKKREYKVWQNGVYVYRNELRAEQLDELTKLEAEL